MIQETGFAKINLGLTVIGRRPDGYHLLDSLVVFADAGDLITVHTADTLNLTMDGPEVGALQAQPMESNLIWRAATSLQFAAGITQGAAIHLHKHLPVASGIGGGSADAAATLRALNQLWQLHWPLEKLATLAQPLGADVPVCVHSTTCRIRGIGEQLCHTQLEHPYAIVLINPRKPLSTPAVFDAWDEVEGQGLLPAPPEDYPHWNLGSLHNWRNELEPAAMRHMPLIADLLQSLEHLPDVRLVRMSGSGPTCYALFETLEAAEQAARLLREQRPDDWVDVSRLRMSSNTDVWQAPTQALAQTA